MPFSCPTTFEKECVGGGTEWQIMGEGGSRLDEGRRWDNNKARGANESPYFSMLPSLC